MDNYHKLMPMKPYKCREIRWFFNTASSTLLSWFQDYGLDFSDCVLRTDHYLISGLKPDQGVKLREGNVEIKQRTQGPQIGRLSEGVEGYFEEWIKWGFPLKANQSDSSLQSSNPRYWFPVRKERLALKIEFKPQGQFHLHRLEVPLERGCQIEYTRIGLGNDLWFSFGLEWFGPERRDLPQDLSHSLLHGVVLNNSDSYGYPLFLLGKLQDLSRGK